MRNLLPPRLLDCTLRDGSYANDFQFTKRDTFAMVKALDLVGFEFIEIGHGMGLGASVATRWQAAASDADYMSAGAGAVSNSNWGMFCIPGIAKLSDLDAAIDHKMNFIRIGTNVEHYQQARPFIEKAKQHSMFVCCNFMKSYVSDPADFAKYALAAAEYGADLVYIVDSAGGMFPEDLERYVLAIREKSARLRIGFHGHHNLGMGVANSIRAAQLGVELIDTSLQGFGRSIGNTPAEQFIASLIRFGYACDFDLIKVMDIAEKYIQPLIDSKGLSSVDVVAGFALFHSSYMPIIEKYSHLYKVDPRRLIMSVSAQNNVAITNDLVKQHAEVLSKQCVEQIWQEIYLHYVGGEQEYEQPCEV